MYYLTPSCSGGEFQDCENAKMTFSARRKSEIRMVNRLPATETQKYEFLTKIGIELQKELQKSGNSYLRMPLTPAQTQYNLGIFTTT